LDGLTGEGDGLPEYVSGAIDLVFREQGRWVLVDYKTDGTILPATSARYGRQVRAYCRAFEQVTGEKVQEALIFYVSLDRVEPVTG
jgi:ATP-dependent helicase/nuclease subunit A